LFDGASTTEGAMFNPSDKLTNPHTTGNLNARTALRRAEAAMERKHQEGRRIRDRLAGCMLIILDEGREVTTAELQGHYGFTQAEITAQGEAARSFVIRSRPDMARVIAALNL
jgi:hypothetical protein